MEEGIPTPLSFSLHSTTPILETSSPSATTQPTPPPTSLPPPSASSHSMTTRSKHNILKPKRLYQTSTTHPLPDSIEPTYVFKAIKHVE